MTEGETFRGTAYLGDSDEAMKARIIHRGSEDPVRVLVQTLIKAPIDRIRDLWTGEDRNLKKGIDRVS